MKFKLFCFFTFFTLIILLSSTIGFACEIGERKNEDFCNVNNEWVAQKQDGEACQNDFECISNSCINGECTSKSVLEILFFDPLKDLFLPSEQECNTGERRGNEYCEDNTWKSQKSIGSSCTFNYECLTNNCVENTCKATEEEPSEEPSDSIQDRDTKRGEISYEVTKRFSDINAGILSFFKLSHLYIPVKEIGFISNTNLQNIIFKIEKKLNLPSNIPYPSGLVYSYLYLDPDGLLDSYIKSAYIIFWVDKDWLKLNNVNKYSMILQRYTNKWDELSTQIHSEDANNVYYKAETPGFSWFAITSKEEKVVYKEKIIPKEPPYIPECGNSIIDQGENCENCPEDVSCLEDEVCYNKRCIIKEKSLFIFILPFLLILLLFIILVIALVLISKRKRVFIFKKKEVIKPKLLQRPTRLFSKFKAVRIKEGLKKAEIARAARLSVSTITNIEKNIEVKELSKRAALQALNSLIQRRTGIKNKYSYEQVFGSKSISLFLTKKPLFPSRKAEIVLRNYINKSLKAGIPKRTIKTVLLKKGWSEKQIEYIFRSL